ncbi:hypothetical protein LguiA_033419 [Lonicera macranthoides]
MLGKFSNVSSSSRFIFPHQKRFIFLEMLASVAVEGIAVGNSSLLLILQR